MFRKELVFLYCYEMLEDYSKTLQVQRQLQLRIEAQGKYFKKIIEEQQRLSGVLSKAPASDGICPESENKTDPGSLETNSQKNVIQTKAFQLMIPPLSTSLRHLILTFILLHNFLARMRDQ